MVVDKSLASAPHNGRGGRSMQGTLALWLSIVALLSCLAVGGITYALRASELRELLFTRLELVRDNKVRNLTEWVHETTGNLNLWAVTPSMIDLCQEFRQGRDVHVEENYQRLQAMCRTYSCHIISVCEPETGRPMITTGDPHHVLQIFPQQYRDRVNREQTVVISDIFLCPLDRRPLLLIAGPILDDAGDVLGILLFHMDPRTTVYPLLTSDRLGRTGEALIVTREQIGQSPLKYREEAICNFVLRAEPARLGAMGHTGRMVTDDYRSVPVVAAYGHVDGPGWGLVVKQDLSESVAPVRGLLRHVAIVTVVSLLAAVFLGWLIAKGVSRPATSIAAVAELIGAGDLAQRVRVSGPAEIRTIAGSLNRMVERLTQQIHTRRSLAGIYQAASGQSNLNGLLGETVPRIMEATRSQLAVVYMAENEGRTLRRTWARGVVRERLPQTLHTSPPDALLAQAIAAGEVQVLREIPEETGLLITTQAGETPPRSLLGVPLSQSGHVIGVIGLASLYDYRDEDLEIAAALRLSLGAAVAACLATEETHRIADRLRLANDELSTANEELQAQSEELQSQTEELREQADELEAQRLRLAEADRLKSEFLSNMSHELRTPLNSIMALSQLMIARGPGVKPEQDTEYLKVIDRNGRHLLRLINDVLDLARIEAGRMEAAPGECDPRRVVERALETVRPLAEAKGLAVRVSIGEVPTMWTDADKLHQVLLNLLSNAAKFTDRGGIEVSANGEDDTIVFTIRDTGIGIAPGDLENIFSEFRQADGSVTRRHEGTGLGLAICRRLVRLLGGRITVASTPGEGSTFTLNVPLRMPMDPVPTDAPVGPAQTPLPAPEPRRTEQKVLVVDDDIEACSVLKECLGQAGYNVIVTRSGREGLRLARELQPSVITLDVLMPDMDGWEVLRDLKADPRTMGIPVIMVSVSEDRGTGAALAAAGQVGKPINPSVLVAEVSRAARWGSGRRVLVVEDNEIAALQIQVALEESGYAVTVAAGGSQALEAIRQEVPDAVVLDLMMPDVDGFEVLRQIRAGAQTANTPVLVLTAKELTAEDRARLTHGSVRQLIQKGSVDRDQLLAAVGRMVGGPAPVVTASEPPSTEVPSSAVSKPAPRTGTREILVVEDNPDNLLTMRAILDELEYPYRTVTDGEQAVRAAKEARPGLILLDLQLPVLSGLDAMRRIKADPTLADVPVVVLTARAMKGDREAALAAGCDEYLSKPLDRDRLIEVLHRWLG